METRITRCAALLGLSALTGLAQAQTPRQSPPTTHAVTPDAKAVRRHLTDAELRNISSVEQFVKGLPSWDAPSKDAGVKKTGGNKSKDVIRTDYSLETTPQEIVTFEPVNGFWLGALVQETGLRAGRGSMREIPVPAAKRAPFNLTTDLLVGDSVRSIPQPSAGAVQSSLGGMIQKTKGQKTGSSIDYKFVENHSAEQTALALGLDAHYMGGRVSASLESKESRDTHSISAIFVEKAFTAKADFEGRGGASAYFNAGFTPEDAQNLAKSGAVTTKNRPCYVASITYGRMLVFTLTAKSSSSELKGAVDAMYNAGFAGGELSVSAKKLLSDASTEIHVTSVGGPTEATAGLIKTGKLSEFFAKSAPLSSMVPISYTVNSVREQILATMQRTTSYSTYEYPPAQPTGIKYKISMWVELLDARDKGTDADIYGEMRIDGKLAWEAPRNQKVYKVTGQTIDLLKDQPFEYYYDKKNQWQVSCFLKDEDNVGDDDLGKFRFDLNPYALLPKGDSITRIVTNQDDRDRNDGNSRLYIRITRVGLLDK